MLDYKDILNKHFVLHLSAREISQQTGVSKSGILKFLHAFERCENLDYSLTDWNHKCRNRHKGVWQGARGRWPK